MVSSSSCHVSNSLLQTVTVCRHSSEKTRLICRVKPTNLPMINSSLSAPQPSYPFLHKSILPVATSLAIILCSSSANAGFLSGSTGIESVPGPELPKLEFLDRFNAENQKRYADVDAKFKASPILKELLEKSKLNKEKNKQTIQDKYCLRGAEMGVGDCSAEGMSVDDRDKFIAMLRAKIEAK